jgi:hypothetical protein
MPPPAKNSRKVGRFSRIDENLKQNDDSRNARPALITSPAFESDQMEPERPKVDRAVLARRWKEALHRADFTIREDGVVRLNPELARPAAGLASRLN